MYIYIHIYTHRVYIYIYICMYVYTSYVSLQMIRIYVWSIGTIENIGKFWGFAARWAIGALYGSGRTGHTESTICIDQSTAYRNIWKVWWRWGGWSVGELLDTLEPERAKQMQHDGKRWMYDTCINVWIWGRWANIIERIRTYMRRLL
jgi:hypothetical protein